MTTIPKIDSLDSEIEINGVAVAMSYKYTAADEGAGGWINGRATVAGKTINVGGGWVDADGDVTDYAESETGDLDDLIEAVGLDATDDDDRETVMDALAGNCPGEWPDVDSETLGEDVGEYTTAKVVRVGDDLFLIDENGGDRGAHQNYNGSVESIDATEAKRLLLSFGMSPREVARKMR